MACSQPWTTQGLLEPPRPIVNASGQVAGYYYDADGGSHGFVESNGVFTTLNAPGTVYTDAYSINASGQVAGLYWNGRGNHGFVESNGVFTTLNVPGVYGNAAVSINDSGQIAGYYFDYSGYSESFVATPTNATTPIPSAIWLVGSALAGLIGFGRRHV